MHSVSAINMKQAGKQNIVALQGGTLVDSMRTFVTFSLNPPASDSNFYFYRSFMNHDLKENMEEMVDLQRNCKILIPSPRHTFS